MAERKVRALATVLKAAQEAQMTTQNLEQERQRRIKAITDRRDYPLVEMREKFAPGTHGCHEALHVASMLGDFVDERLCNHPAVLLNPEWYRLASAAQDALFELYQAIGSAHLGDEKHGQ
ncbi:hypothetical protein QN219_04935 [Sinorhizobium sp. 7-81]|uniref:hypothetical protein n=1 Tax=Sinorhizobium sp. 8-89 TaxID=3049089 RepID=UPI0024C278E0|nr:hypothetical protein [Sinorhizobium sp. 8-89]MDK1489401.1 hypothetical protein [Sinorhizobium sp. 8-89]